MKFTEAGIKAPRPRESRYEVWKDNGEGLGLRISPQGRKSFIFLYRFNGRPRRMTLGVFPRMPKFANTLSSLSTIVDKGPSFLISLNFRHPRSLSE